MAHCHQPHTGETSMRPILMATGLAAALALTACGEPADKAAEAPAAAAPAKKSLGRQRQM